MLTLFVSAMLFSAATAQQSTPAPGASTMPPTTAIKINGKPVFPIGLYAYPKCDPQRDIFKAMAEAGINFYLMPPSVSKEQLDQAQANGIQIMLTMGGAIDFRGTPEQIDQKKKDLAKLIGPDSMIFKHPAVVAFEHGDESLWNVKYAYRDKISPELATWVRSKEQRDEIYALLKGMRDGYAEVRRLCGDRYQVWLNFAPRDDENELRWFTELPTVGGYEQDGRTTADVFGTDIYPVPDGGGNNGWIRGRFVPSIATVGAFTEKLRRAVHPHPFYMVLQGCGIEEYNPQAVQAGQTFRRPALDEAQFMAFDAIVHGAGGIVYWGQSYIDEDSLYWRQLTVVTRRLRALAPMLAEGTPWLDARAGEPWVEVLGKVHNGEHYVIATNNMSGNAQGLIAVPGWKGDRAYSLLDGRNVPVVDGIIHDPTPGLTARVYADGTSLFKALGWPAPAVLAKRPMRTIFGLPLELEPFKDKSPEEVATILKDSGVDGVGQVPADAKLIAALHDAGIKAYAEIGCFAGKDAWKANPKTQPITAEGTPYEDDYGGVCLNQESYVVDLLARIDQLLGQASFDGLWLDFIRWPGKWEEKEPKLTPLCFCDTCLAHFATDRNVYYPSSLTTTKDKAAWILKERATDWAAWKCDRVADVVARIRQVMKARLGSDAVLGIFGVPMRQSDFDGAIQRTFGQDPARLAQYVDVFSPMVYHVYCHRPLEWISQVTAEVSERSGRIVWPIVQSCSLPTEVTADEFTKALHEGLKTPSNGIMVYATSYTIQEKKWDTMAKVYNEAK